MNRALRRDESPLRGAVFYLQLDDAPIAAELRRKIERLGGTARLHPERSATHLVVDEPPCRGGRADSESEKDGVRRGFGRQTRTDAMLESALDSPRARTPTVPRRARLWGVPVWTLRTVEKFLNDINRAVKNGVDSSVKKFKGSYVKFQSLDGENRAIYKEFAEWPRLNLSRDRSGPPFAVSDDRENAEELIGEALPGDADRREPARSKDPRSRMTRKNRPRRVDVAHKQSGYCEICRASYSALSEHERTPAHVNFAKNCSNFLSLDSLINQGADVETFLEMNKSNICERRSLRNVIRVNQESESLRRQLKIVCDGDDSYRRSSPKENKKSGVFVDLDGDAGRYLRSKGSNVVDDSLHKVSPRNHISRNGSMSPRALMDKQCANGKIDKFGCEPAPKTRLRSIRWRRPSPDSNPAPPDNRTYYKVVGVSAKLRSSGGFQTPKEAEPPAPPPAKPLCNGQTDAGLVVKFRRVRRSELSVLSDEAENFMFPKKDDSDSTEDEAESSHRSRRTTSASIPSSDPCLRKVKEEVLSGDDASQDSCGSDRAPRKGRRKRAESGNGDLSEHPKASKRRHRSSSDSKDETIVKQKTDTDARVPNPIGSDSSPTIEKCLKWENGRLKASPEVENLTFAFENVPKYEPWYNTYKRQDDGNERNHDIAQYLGYYWKSPILPYEMGQLPPLKPNCCALSQLKKATETKPGPSRLYGTRGMKKKKVKLETVFNLSRNPRKSPREHASTLAILGSLVHKRRSKFSSSEDTKSLPSIAEEDTSSDNVPFVLKLPEIQVPESSKKLEEFFSSLVDNDEYDTLVDNLDESLHLDRAVLKPNVIDLLQNYDECEAIENSVIEMQTAIRQNDGRRRRKGQRFKKKNNRTGWPAKKRVPAKKDTASTAESVCSSREASVNREAIEGEESTSGTVLEETESNTDKTDPVKESGADNIKGQNVNINFNLVLEDNENSIISVCDEDEKTLNSLKCKNFVDVECSNSEDGDDHAEIANNVDENIKNWVSSERTSVSERTNSDKEKMQHHSLKDLQPVVRVQKIDTKVTSLGRKRKLRSSGARRRLRASQNR